MTYLSMSLTITAAGLLALGACTSNVETFDDGDGGSGAGNGGLPCSEFADESPGASVSVTVKNNGAAPIYLTGTMCTANIDLRVKDSSGVDKPWQRDSCSFTCEDLQDHDGLCAADCALPPVVVIEPNGSYQLAWAGTLLEAVDMPASCFFNSEYYPSGSCLQQLVAADGSYQLSVDVYDAVISCDGPGCECTPDANGACEMYSASVDGPARNASVTASYPSETTVEIGVD